MLVCVRMDASKQSVRVYRMSEHVERCPFLLCREGPPYSVTLRLTSLRQGTTVNLILGRWPVSMPQDPHPQSGVTGVSAPAPRFSCRRCGVNVLEHHQLSPTGLSL